MKKMLVAMIDDDLINFHILKRACLMSKKGDQVDLIYFENAIKALDYILSNQHLINKIPDYIFIDYHMPGMNGLEFLDKFSLIRKGIDKRVKVFMMSSTSNPDELEKINSSSQIEKFIPKPLSEAQFLEICPE